MAITLDELKAQGFTPVQQNTPQQQAIPQQQNINTPTLPNAKPAPIPKQKPVTMNELQSQGFTPVKKQAQPSTLENIYKKSGVKNLVDSVRQGYLEANADMYKYLSGITGVAGKNPVSKWAKKASKDLSYAASHIKTDNNVVSFIGKTVGGLVTPTTPLLDNPVAMALYGGTKAITEHKNALGILSDVVDNVVLAKTFKMTHLDTKLNAAKKIGLISGAQNAGSVVKGEETPKQALSNTTAMTLMSMLGNSNMSETALKTARSIYAATGDIDKGIAAGTAVNTLEKKGIKFSDDDVNKALKNITKEKYMEEKRKIILRSLLAKQPKIKGLPSNEKPAITYNPDTGKPTIPLGNGEKQNEPIPINPSEGQFVSKSNKLSAVKLSTKALEKAKNKPTAPLLPDLHNKSNEELSAIRQWAIDYDKKNKTDRAIKEYNNSILDIAKEQAPEKKTGLPIIGSETKNEPTNTNAIDQAVQKEKNIKSLTQIPEKNNLVSTEKATAENKTTPNNIGLNDVVHQGLRALKIAKDEKNGIATGTGGKKHATWKTFIDRVTDNNQGTIKVDDKTNRLIFTGKYKNAKPKTFEVSPDVIKYVKDKAIKQPETAKLSPLQASSDTIKANTLKEPKNSVTAKPKTFDDFVKSITLNDLNPSGGVFVKHIPEKRTNVILGKDLTTLDKTANKHPNDTITIYRGVPKGEQSKIVAGDFITTNKQLAKDYAGNGNVISKKVKYNDIIDSKDEPLSEEYLYIPKNNIIIKTKAKDIWDKIQQGNKDKSLSEINAKSSQTINGEKGISIKEGKTIPVMTEEEYLAANNASKLDIGDSALHKNIPEGKIRQKMVEYQAGKDKELIKKRDKLREEYKKKVKNGEIRQPSRVEVLMKTAQGMPEKESVKAAKRLLTKQGIDWKTGKKINLNDKVKSVLQNKLKKEKNKIWEIDKKSLEKMIKNSYGRIKNYEDYLNRLLQGGNYIPPEIIKKYPKLAKKWLPYDWEITQKKYIQKKLDEEIKPQEKVRIVKKGGLYYIQTRDSKKYDFKDNIKVISAQKNPQLKWLAFKTQKGAENYIKKKLMPDYEWYYNHFKNDLPKTHKNKIKRALKEGYPIPEEVLKDYPDLKKEYANKPIVKNNINLNDNPDIAKLTSNAIKTKISPEDFEKKLTTTAKGKKLADIIQQAGITIKEFYDKHIKPNLPEMSNKGFVGVPDILTNKKFEKVIKTADKVADTTQRMVERVFDEQFEPGTVREATASILAKHIGNFKHSKDIAYKTVEENLKWWSTVKESQAIDIIDAIETNSVKSYVSGLKKNVANYIIKQTDNFRERLDRVHKLDNKAGITHSYIKDYFPHIWDNSADEVRVFLDNYRRKVGNDAYAKTRTIKLIREGIKAGLKLKTTNLEELVTIREVATLNNISKLNALNDMAKFGFATFAPKKNFKFERPLDGTILSRVRTIGKRMSDKGNVIYGKLDREEIINVLPHLKNDKSFLNGFTAVKNTVSLDTLAKDMNISKNAVIVKIKNDWENYKNKTSEYYKERKAYNERLEKFKKANIGQKMVQYTAPDHKLWFMTNEAAQVFNDAFPKESLWTQKDVVGKAFRATMYSKNSYVAAKLGVSLFHFVHISTIKPAAESAMILQKMINGNIKKKDAFTRFAKTITFLDQYRDVKNGLDIKKAWNMPLDKLTPEMREKVQMIADGGGSPEMSAENVIRMVRSYKIANKSLAGKGFEFTTRMFELMQKPILDKYVPALKIDTYLKRVKRELEINPGMSDLEQLKMKRKMWQETDAMFGQMVYDTLFWNKRIKEASQASLLSLGWQLGFIKTFGGSAIDASKAFSNLITGNFKKSDITYRTLYAATYTTYAALVGGLMTSIIGGVTPKTIADFFYPRVGGKNPDGTPRRVNTVFFTREPLSIINHLRKEGILGGTEAIALSKANPVLITMSELLKNSDYYGYEISSSDNKLLSIKRAEDYIAYVAKSMLPISVTSAERTGDLKGAILSVMGNAPAPKYISETKIMTKIYRRTKLRFGGSIKTKESRDKREFRNKVLDLYYTGKDKEFSEKLIEGIKKGYIPNSLGRVKAWIRASQVPPYLRAYKRLSSADQKGIWNDMSKKEKLIYYPFLRPDLKRKYASTVDVSKSYQIMRTLLRRRVKNGR